jgi:branched-chain amino acid transport system permease protein
MSFFLQTLIDAMAIGALYALTALGYTMVYGVLRFINFAHSDVFAVGAWAAVVSATAMTAASAASPWMLLVVFPLSMLICGVLALLIERFAYRPLRHAPRLNVLITAIGVSLLLQNVGQLPFVFGNAPKPMPALVSSITFPVAAATIHLIDIISIASAVLLMVGLEILIFHTRLGRAMRAVSYDVNTAALMGINVDRIISFTFVLGAVLAGAAGVLFAQKYPVVQQPAFYTWVLLGLKAFVAAVVGGIGNVRGAMVGGLLIGLIEHFSKAYVSTQLADVFVFLLLILVLLARPGGIMGSNLAEKV